MPDAADNPPLWLSGTERTADQRAAFGKFCLNAASHPLPGRVIQHLQAGRRIQVFRRKFLRLLNLIVTALVEPVAGPSADVWAIVPLLLGALSGPPPDILKVFVAGAAPGAAAGTRRIGAYQATFLPFSEPEVLDLPATFDGFLAALGRRTRRDMRRLRRDAEAAGLAFEYRPSAPLDAAERRHLGRVTHPKPYRPAQIDAYDTFLAAQEKVFYASLRAASGELLSCCAGLVSDRAAIMIYQLNHRAYLDASLSLTMRSFLIERLIEDGLRELILPGGGSGLLVHFCRIRRTGELILIRRSALAFAKAALIAVLRPDSSVSLALRASFRAGLFR